jgi:hypothetical protein
MAYETKRLTRHADAIHGESDQQRFVLGSCSPNTKKPNQLQLLDGNLTPLRFYLHTNPMNHFAMCPLPQRTHNVLITTTSGTHISIHEMKKYVSASSLHIQHLYCIICRTKRANVFCVEDGRSWRSCYEQRHSIRIESLDSNDYGFFHFKVIVDLFINMSWWIFTYVHRAIWNPNEDNHGSAIASLHVSSIATWGIVEGGGACKVKWRKNKRYSRVHCGMWFWRRFVVENIEHFYWWRQAIKWVCVESTSAPAN